MNTRSGILMACAALGCSASCQAWEVRCRFIERVGNVNVVLPGNMIDASNGAARSIRVQFGVFDDADGPAPAGGCSAGTRGRSLSPGR
ncbi:MAG: hypothetical protein AB7G11_00615 [Phycisphaerales bacterium]